MADTNKPDIRKQTSDEIDLLELFRKTGNTFTKFVTWLWELFLRSTVFFIRKAPYLIAAIVLGFLVAIYFYASSERFYDSDMVLQSNAVTNPDMISHINKLHFFIEEGNIVSLANNLNLDSADVSNIVDLEAFWIIDKNKDAVPDFVDYKNKFTADTNVRRITSRFDLRVRTFEPQNLSKVRDGILFHINNHEYFQKRNEIRLRQLAENILKTEAEMNKLDSLQNFKYFEEKQKGQIKEGQIVFLNEEATKLFHDDIFALFQKKLNLDRTLFLDSAIVTIIDDFTPPAQPVNSYLNIAKTWVIRFFILGLIIVIALNFRKEITSVYKKY